MLINVLTGRGFRRVSPWVQMALMGVLIVMLFLTPLACASIRPLVQRDSPLLRWFPPFWFLGPLSRHAARAPGRSRLPRTRRAGAPGAGDFRRALSRSPTSPAITATRAASCKASKARSAGPAACAPPSTRAVNRWLLPHPLERATFHFISNTMLRTARQRLFLAAYGGIAVALTLPAVLRIGTRPGTPILLFEAAGLLSVPLTLSFFAVSGLRAAFNFPAELRANWVFQICESEDRVLHMRAARKWIALMGIAPLFVTADARSRSGSAAGASRSSI